MSRKIIAVFPALMMAAMLSGCVGISGQISGDSDDAKLIEDWIDSENDEESKEHEVIEFFDAHGEVHFARLDENAAMNKYDKECFVSEDGVMKYKDKKYETRLGIDVSRHQGNIDWKKVRDYGVEFAFLRIGYRGYGEDGTLNEDSMFYQNYEGARAQGIDVGVYFFAQAVNKKEAREEAEFVLDMLGDRQLQLPIVYDPESILNDTARTDGVSGEQFTKNTKAFCRRIRQAGRTPAVYANMVWEANLLDMSELKKETLWYADYLSKPQTPYAFKFWQYSCEGSVPGVSGDCDLDIEIRKNK